MEDRISPIEGGEGRLPLSQHNNGRGRDRKLSIQELRNFIVRRGVEEYQKNNSANNLGRDHSHSRANFTEPLHLFPS